MVLALAALASPASAQEVSENRNWQFETPQEQAARTATLDLMLKRRAGIYAAPVYNTTIARQYNCSVAATATGNGDAQSAVANSPTATGTSANATGNASTTQAGDAGASIDTAQHNGGAVAATAVGSTSAGASGPAWQALNSDQTNSGDLWASVQGSTACRFGAIN